MNRFFTTMYKERGKPHYPENIAKAEHERLLSSTLLVNPLHKKSYPQQINQDPVIVQKIRDEKKRLTKNYQLFLDTYHDHFSGKLKKSKNKIKRNSSPPSSKKFNITVNQRNPVPRQGKFLKPYSRKCLQLDLKFVESESPPPEMSPLYPPPQYEQPKSTMHNFVLEELERTNEEIDSFSTQLQAIQGILHDRKVELKFPTADIVEEETIKAPKSKESLARTLDKHFRNTRNKELPKMHYRSMADALFGKKKTTSLELLYSNDSFDNKQKSFGKLTESNSGINVDMAKKNTADSTIRLEKSSTSTVDVNSKFPFPKFRPIYKPGIGSISTPIPKKEDRNTIMKLVEKAKSYSCEKSPKTSLKLSPRPIGRYNLSKNKHFPNNKKLKPNTELTPNSFKANCGDQKPKMSPRRSPKVLKRSGHYPNDTNCVMASYIEQKLTPKSPLHVSGGGYGFVGQNESPKSNDKPTEFQKVLQENVPHGIFGNKDLPKGITNSLFLKSELKRNPFGPSNEDHHNARAVFLRKLQQAQHNAKQQDLLGLPKNNSPYAKQKNNLGLYSTFRTALKDTLFEPEKNAV